MKLVECVPNFSEGKNLTTINEIADAIHSVPGVSLLHIDSNKSANRTVYTFIGEAERVLEAAFRAIQTAAKLIDMSIQRGVHPRLGSCDVCPLIPLQNISIDECTTLSQSLAQRVADELLIPVFSYENDSQQAYRKKLEQIRYGEYEALQEKLLFPEWQPNYGLNFFNKKNGATVIGSRNFLIAFNINLETKDVAIAKNIAATIRESGKSYTDTNGIGFLKPGLLTGIKAIGWYIDDFDKTQVSTNITNFNITSLYTVFETVSQLAKEHGTKVSGSELIGLIPMQALLESSRKYQSHENIKIEDRLESLLYVVEKLGLDELQPFDISQKIIEIKGGLYLEE